MAKRIKKTEIDFRDPNQTRSLPAALNHYSQTFDFDDSKKWALEWIQSNLPDLFPVLADVPSLKFSNRGFVCRLIENGLQLDIQTELSRFFAELAAEHEVSLTVKEDKPKPKRSINSIIWELEGALDDIASDKEPSDIDLIAADRTISEALGWCEKEIVWLNQILERNQKSLELLTSVANRCRTIKEQSKSTTRKRVVRKPKQEDKTKIQMNALKTMSYIKEMPELGIEGRTPAAIVGATKVVILHTKTRDAFVFIGSAKGSLSVKGRKIVGFSESKSYRKKMRKPELLNAKDPIAVIEQQTTKKQPIRALVSPESIIVYAAE